MTWLEGSSWLEAFAVYVGEILEVLQILRPGNAMVVTAYIVKSAFQKEKE